MYPICEHTLGDSLNSVTKNNSMIVPNRETKKKVLLARALTPALRIPLHPRLVHLRSHTIEASVSQASIDCARSPAQPQPTHAAQHPIRYAHHPRVHPAHPQLVHPHERLLLMLRLVLRLLLRLLLLLLLLLLLSLLSLLLLLLLMVLELLCLLCGHHRR